MLILAYSQRGRDWGTGREGRQMKRRGTFWGGGWSKSVRDGGFLSKLWKDGSAEAGKRKRNEDITAIRKKCV